MKRCLIMGAGGFIGYHLSKALKEEGNFVVGVDLKRPEFADTPCDVFYTQDLRNDGIVRAHMLGGFDWVMQLAADMGGAGYVFTGDNDRDIMLNSGSININVARYAEYCDRLFFSSSACIYQKENRVFNEDSAYPAMPDSEYGWEKLFAERVYQSCSWLTNIRIARFHNIFGPYGTFRGGKEKFPAAICRKVIEAENGGKIDVWGDGSQVRSFLYIDDCIKGILALMRSDKAGPYNIGSDDCYSINSIAEMTIDYSKKNIEINNIPGPVGVDYRNSHNEKVFKEIGWQPVVSFEVGLKKTYEWIKNILDNESGCVQEQSR